MIWQRRAFCKCGFSHKPAFGEIWFTRNDFPVCPECGESSYGFEMKTVKWVSTGSWWHPSGHWQFREEPTHDL